MASGSRTALALVPEGIVPRLQAALLRNAIAILPAPAATDAPEAFAACCQQPIHAVLLSQRDDGSEAAVCKLLRSVGFPVLLFSNATNPVQVNAARKSLGASAALGATFQDGDLLAALKTLLPDTPPVERAAVKLPMSTPAAENDPVWTLGRYCVRRSTGFIKLAAASGTAEVTVHLSDGNPVTAVSNVRGARLGEILVRSGKVPQEHVERAMRVVERKAGAVRLGTVLVDQGVITKEEMLREVGAQYVARILTAFAWPAIAPHVRFEPIPEDDARIPMTREALVLDGLRKKYNVIRLKPLVPMDAVYEWTKDAAPRLASFGFERKESDVLAGVDGARPVSALVAATGNPHDGLRAFYAAYCLDLIRPRGQT